MATKRELAEAKTKAVLTELLIGTGAEVKGSMKKGDLVELVLKSRKITKANLE